VDSFTPHGATFDAFARDLAPPLRWTLPALVGVLLALVSIAPRDRALRERLTWCEETHDGVAVLVSPDAPGGGYRDSARAQPPFVAEGTLAGVREQLARVVLGRWMFAIAAVVLTGTPLFVAAALGFLRG
jgi:hypothetical protein